MNLKAIWPFSIYYRMQSDVDYYRERNKSLMIILNARNNEISKNRDEIRRMWNEKVSLVEYLSNVESKLRVSAEENKSLKQLVDSLATQAASNLEPIAKPEIPINGILRRKRTVGKMGKFYPAQEGHGIIIGENDESGNKPK